MTELERLQRENAELRRDETRQERDDLRIRRNELEAKLAAAEALFLEMFKYNWQLPTGAAQCMWNEALVAKIRAAIDAAKTEVRA